MDNAQKVSNIFDNVLNIPDELQKINKWVTVVLKKDKNNKMTKLPYQINCKLAKVNDESTWNTFENCYNKFRTDNTLNGLGYVLSITDNFIIVDIDHVNIHNDEKLKFIKKYNTYTELSQSNNGYHMIFKIDNKKKFLEHAQEINLLNYADKLRKYKEKVTDTIPCFSLKRNDYELYLDKRYFWLTGNIVEDKFKIQCINWKELIDIIKYIEGLKPTKNKQIDNISVSISSPKLSDKQVLELCNHASNSEKFQKLWSADVDYEKLEYNNDTSRADIALTNIITFYTQDVYQVKRLLRKSNRNRDKFNRDDYLERTITDSINSLETTYNPNFSYDLDDIPIDTNDTAYWHYRDSKRIIQLDINKLVQHLITSINHCIVNTEAGFYVYSAGAYKYTSKNSIKLLIEKHVHNNFKYEKIINEVCNRLLRREQNFEILNKTNNIIVFNNTVIQFHNNGVLETIEHSEKYLTTCKIEHDYNQIITCSKWLQVLQELLSLDQVKLMQELFGYVLTMNNAAKKLFAFLGKGNTGKSLITKIIYKMLGTENIAALSLQDICNPRSNFRTSDLHSKLANIYGDMSSKSLYDSSLIKMLTGDDLIHAERKYLGSFKFYNMAKMIFAMNELPPSYNDRTNAFYDRWIIIPFENVIPVQQQNKNLHNEIDIQGVINWSLEGLKRLLKNKLIFSTTKTNNDIIDQYKKDNSNVYQFSSENIIDCKENDVSINTLYDNYRTYCIENGYNNLGRNKFISELRQNGYEYSNNCKINNKRVRGLKNVKLNDLPNL